MTEEEIKLTPEQEKEYNMVQNFGPVSDWRFNPVNGQPLERGLKNFKNLFRKPTLSEWINLIIIIIALIGAFFYYQDTKTCRETLNNLPVICSQYQASELIIQQNKDNQSNSLALDWNFTVINFSLLNPEEPQMTINITSEEAQII